MTSTPHEQQDGEQPPPAAVSLPLREALETDAHDLSAEEQMARYEEALKESDWGHQPC
ncbi:MAG: hypothetical protein K1X78_10055 [Verrucomicrobiaceae bacterium]|nr:hypothetical protein [Verrucomicrobiaceae bacterium]